jgi:hypothetical protein
MIQTLITYNTPILFSIVLVLKHSKVLIVFLSLVFFCLKLPKLFDLPKPFVLGYLSFFTRSYLNFLH